MTRVVFSVEKKVVFEEFHIVKTVESHNDYTPSERQSSWFTKQDYRQFKLNVIHEKLTGPLSERKRKHERSMRIENVRRSVLKAQSNRLLGQKLLKDNKDFSRYSEWLSDYVYEQSEQSAIEARQRGMENDLELLDIKMQEMTSRRSERPAFLSKKKQTPMTNKYNKKKNARWSTNDEKQLKDVAPNAVKRNPVLRGDLCSDICSDKSGLIRRIKRKSTVRRTISRGSPILVAPQ